MANRVQVDYEGLSGLIQQFRQESEGLQQVVKEIQAEVNHLANGNFIGQAANAFFREMEERVTPQLDRLPDVMRTAADYMQIVSQQFTLGEDETERMFGLDDDE